jgi:glutathione S-transferase
VLDDGEVLIASAVILDALDQMAGAGGAMTPPAGPERRKALKVCALATGLADKAVSLGYERVIHKRETEAWVERCLSQIAGVLGELEASRAQQKTEWWFGPSIGHADIAVAVALRFLGDAHAGLFDLPEGWPLLAAHAAKCEALPPFLEIQQPFSVTLPRA